MKTSKFTGIGRQAGVHSFVHLLGITPGVHQTNQPHQPAVTRTVAANSSRKLTAKQIADQVIASAFKARGEPRYAYERIGDMVARAGRDPASGPTSPPSANSLPRQSASDLAAQIHAAAAKARGG